jgi:hypothetical protein
LLSSSTSVAGVCTNADTVETDLWTYNLPANTLNEDGKTVRIVAWGDYGATANTKVVHLYAGGVALTPATTLANNGTGWVAQGWVTRTAAAQELGKAFVNSTSGQPNATTRTLTSDTTAIIPLKITGTNGTAAASDICFRGVNVSLEQTTTNNIVTSTGGPVANPILLPNGVAAAPALGFASEPALGFYRSGSNSLVFSTTSGTDVFRISNIGPIVNASSTLSWGSTGISGPDTFLNRDGANILALRNGPNGQSFKLYNTFTDASNNEKLALTWLANVATIQTSALGTGTARAIRLDSASTANTGIGFAINGADKWRVNGANGGFEATTDNTVDIGASGANRPRSLFVGTSLNVGSNFSVSSGGTITTTGGSGINFSSASRIQSATDGNITLYNQAITDFSLLQFGGTGIGFPALRRNGTALEVKLADDSAHAPFKASAVNVPNGGIFQLNNVVFVSATAPTINSGFFSTSPSIANANGSAAFVINVGTVTAASSGVINMPNATNGWNCFANNITAAAAHRAEETVQIGSTTNTVTFENQNKATAAATNWSASDLIRVSCFGY